MVEGLVLVVAMTRRKRRDGRERMVETLSRRRSEEYR